MESVPLVFSQGLAAILAASGGSPLPGPQRRFLRQQLAVTWMSGAGVTMEKSRVDHGFTRVLG
jgi:hypothetical protein